MTEDEAIAEAQRWYIDYLLEPYNPAADVRCSTPEVIDEGYYIEVWSDMLPSVFGVVVYWNGAIDLRDET
jgi:hypothetical protein